MTDADVIAAIRANHLKANIAGFETAPDCVVLWDEATVDPGGTVFGPGPYLHVPIVGCCACIVVRVYPPARLRRRLAKLWTPKEEDR
jgi:hypothetical protein